MQQPSLRGCAVLILVLELLVGYFSANGAVGFVTPVAFGSARTQSLASSLQSTIPEKNTLKNKFSKWRHQVADSWTIRGAKEYSRFYNNTVSSPEEVSKRVGVKATAKVPKWIWVWSQKFWTRYFLPLCHRFDPLTCHIRNLDQGLCCLWWKALSGNDKRSIVHDHWITHDMLPPYTRIFVSPCLTRFYPRLLHVNVEMRTAYLDARLRDTIQTIREASPNTKIRLVSLGAGYDTRSLRFSSLVDQCIELDRDEVLAIKGPLIERFMTRRNKRQQLNHSIIDVDKVPLLLPTDLNNFTHVESLVSSILDGDFNEIDTNKLKQPSNTNYSNWHTIFLYEAVMIYLDKGIPSALLAMCSKETSRRNNSSTLIFADRLENCPGGEEILGRQHLLSNGWNLVDWCSKPGFARHMGLAILAST